MSKEYNIGIYIRLSMADEDLSLIHISFSLEFLSKRHFGNHSCSQKVCDIKLRKSIDKGT